METFALYLIKSAVWLTGFFLIYILFLRNERFFTLNRIYLVSGILVSIVFPLFTWHYTVIFPVTPTAEIAEPQVQAVTAASEPFKIQDLLLYIYLSGAIFLVLRMIKQIFSVWKVIQKSDRHHFNSVKLVRTDRYPAPFSFFSFVFVNPSTDETETNEIVNHEQEHIRQRHWMDLLLFEILRTMHWFNPVSWLYGRLIRQNHEYLADERALQRTSNPAVYRAALLNQMFGGPVISLANSFNYSLNKKRFNMMKQITYSPIRKLKLLLVLPLIAGVFYAFATPEYKFVQAESSTEISNLQQNLKTVKGKVIKEDGTPLRGTSIVVKHGTNGTLSGENGSFELKVENDTPLVFSFVGFGFQEVKPDFDKEMVITMKRVVISIDAVGNKPSDSEIFRTSGPVLTFVDGKETSEEDMKKIKPDQIESVSALRKKEFTDKYGEKGKNGVVLITLKKSPSIEFSAKEIETKDNESVILKEPQKLNIKSENGKQPLIVIDGAITENKKLEDIDPETIQSLSVLKDEKAIQKYGDKGKNGVVEITLKKEKEVFIVVEEMPEYPGGVKALQEYVRINLQYPKIALENGIVGQVTVGFTVAEDGSVTDAKVVGGVDPSLNQEALRIVNSMPKWTPGKQRGMPVSVKYEMPINFTYPADYHPKSREKLREKK